MVASRLDLDIYGGKAPGEVPVYLMAEAARYLRLPPATGRSWTVGREYPTGKGKRAFAPLIEIADPDDCLLSFRNLVELHVLSSIRRIHHVQLKAVRRAIKFLAERFESEHPLLSRQMLTDGKDLFIEQYGEVVNVSADGQMEMKRVLEMYLKRIERDKHGLPIRLFPFTRKGGGIEVSPRWVSIDPSVRFGKPCIAGTGIPTAIIAERYEAGDSIALLAEDYGRSPEEIEEAIRYETRLAS